MTSHRWISILLSPAVVFAAWPATVRAQTEEPDARRVRGVIDTDQVWSGKVLITEDVTIDGATVTVAGGTVIEFACSREGRPPKLTVGGPIQAASHLVLQSTAETPVTFRTRPETNRGRIILNVRNRIVTQSPTKLDPATSAPTTQPGEVVWRHVRFEGLGRSQTREVSQHEVDLVDPAITIQSVDAAHRVVIEDCTFDDAYRVTVRAASGSRVELRNNRFTSPPERMCLEASGVAGLPPPQLLLVSGNRLAAGLQVGGGPLRVEDNVLIGPFASMVVQEPGPGGTTIAGNYIHNTTTEDDGRYGLDCRDPDAEIAGNLIRGGSSCVMTGSRRMRDNVLIGAANLASEVVRNARTHTLVGALPLGSVFENNVLIGPAYSLLVPQPTASPRAAETQPADTPPTIIRHNLFDGLTGSVRAVHVNNPGYVSGRVEVYGNLFLRVPLILFDEGRTTATITYADHNAAAPRSPRAFEGVSVAGVKRGEPGWGARDVSADDVASLYLTAAPPAKLPDWDEDVSAGRLGVDEICRNLLAAYRPRPNSPLIGAGRPRGGPAASTIGPFESSKQDR